MPSFGQQVPSSTSLQSELDPEEDPEIKETRARLIHALDEGEHPPTRIDTVELTVPVEVHRGDHATIYKGVRAGHTVAIKKVNITDRDHMVAA